MNWPKFSTNMSIFYHAQTTRLTPPRNIKNQVEIVEISSKMPGTEMRIS